jgi:hypothetical protein
MAKDFVSDFVFKTAGILYVFQGFDKQKLGQKNRQMPMAIDPGIPGVRQVPTLPYDLHKSAYNIIKHRRYYYVWTYKT